MTVIAAFMPSAATSLSLFNQRKIVRTRFEPWSRFPRACRSQRSLHFKTVMTSGEIPSATSVAVPPLNAETFNRYYRSYDWRGHHINYFVDGPTNGKVLLLVHGFGASINHWRKTMKALLDTGRYKVYAIDLLGFGGSAKPSPRTILYSLELWRDLVIDFVNTFEPTAKWSFIGNSIGSLVSLMTAKELGRSRVESCSLMNSAGGLVSFRKSEMNPLLVPVLQLFNLTFFNPVIGGMLFRNLRSEDTLRKVLLNIYQNPDAVDDDLVNILRLPAFDEGAQEVFLAILNASDAGPTPRELLVDLHWCPILVCWGEDDNLTPFRRGMHPGISFPNYHPTIQIQGIPDCGHCPHDDRPEAVHEHLLPFLSCIN